MCAALDLGVYPLVGESGRYFVRSHLHGSLMYLVDLEELASGWCGCPHFEYRSSLQLVGGFECKHIRAARSYRSLQQKLAAIRVIRRGSWTQCSN